MPTNLVWRAARLLGQLVTAIAVGAAALAVPLLIYDTLSPAGVRARANAEIELQDEIASENRAFCERFGMPVATPDHNRCVKELNEIRARQQQRFADSLAFP